MGNSGNPVVIEVDLGMKGAVHHRFNGLDPILHARPGSNRAFGQGMKALRCNHGKAARQRFEHHQGLTFNAGRQEQHGCRLQEFEFFLLADPPQRLNKGQR